MVLWNENGICSGGVESTRSFGVSVVGSMSGLVLLE